MKRYLILTVVACATLLSSCTTRLIDFTVISSKNVAIHPKGTTKRVVGKSMNIFGLGVTIKDAVDDAIDKSGIPGADILIDGVLRAVNYPFYGGFKIEGTAAASSQMKAEMGETKFKEFCLQHNVEFLAEDKK